MTVTTEGGPARAVAAALPVVLWGAWAGWWMPRGPLTTSQALWSIALSLAAGQAAGLLARTRWTVLAAPVLFAVVFELVRLDLTGPTVDRPQLSAYGVLALIVGRGFHGLVSLFPLALGASLGAAATRAPAPARGSRWRVIAFGLRRAGAVVASVAELTSVRLNGRDQPLMIRGHDTNNPVLLFLAGGPGGSELGAMRRHLPDLERHFTVVTWDQRGAGKAYPSIDPTDTITLDSYVDDTIAVTDHLRERFAQDQVYLVGQSWGSTLGVLAVQRAPDRYAAFVGGGQMVSQLETDRIFYRDTLRWAQDEGCGGLVDELTAIGPPPYTRMLDYETALSHEHDVYPYDRSANHEGIGGFSENLLVREYSLVEQVHLLAGFMDTFAALYPQLQDIDFRRTATELDVPVFFVQGAHEAAGRAAPFEEWYGQLRAPIKDVIHLDTSGHRPMFEQPDDFVTYLVGDVLARTGGGTGTRGEPTTGGPTPVEPLLGAG